jgi:hypothetical protein
MFLCLFDLYDVKTFILIKHSRSSLSAKGTVVVFCICYPCMKKIYLKLFSRLQTSQRSKETWQLQLLLTYLQNGISEEWQRIPSIIAVFAAEASLALLDSSHAQFTAVSNFLMHSTSVSLQVTLLVFICIYERSWSKCVLNSLVFSI